MDIQKSSQIADKELFMSEFLKCFVIEGSFRNQ